VGKLFSRMVLVLMVGFFISCASQNEAIEKSKRPLNPNEQVLGIVQASFEAYLELYGDSALSIYEKAYLALLEVGKREYPGNIDLRDITWVRGTQIKGYLYQYSANGKVILYNSNTRISLAGVEGALEKAAEQIMASIRPNSKIAIVYVTSNDMDTTDFIANELEYLMVNQGFTIIDRSQLDRIRREQNFQLSGDIDDETAVSIGKIVGADIIITGSVTGTDSTRRLRLRALNTQTAQVMAVASERL